MTEGRANGPDPVDGLRLALLQQRAGQLRKRLRFRTFGLMEGLPLAMLVIGIAFLAGAAPGRARFQYLFPGWALIVQAIGLYWSLRHATAKELRRLEQRISIETGSPDGKVIEQAAVAAHDLLLRKR